MFCPKCATENLDNARFCRKCGTDIGVVSQALSGGLVQPDTSATLDGESEAPPNLEKGIKKFLMGLAFLIIAILPVFRGHMFLWWMLFPAAPLLSAGIAELVRMKQRQNMLAQPRAASLPYNPTQPFMPSTTRPAAAALPIRQTNELYPEPPSVTESTTRHLGAEAQTKYLDADASQSRDKS